MKTIGLLGGMSWESTQDYYRLINQGIKSKLGGLHSAKLILNSVDFALIAQMQRENDWQDMADLLVAEAKKIELAGADFLVICTNTMHKVAPHIEQSVNIPLLHIADATGQVLVSNGTQKVALLGTQFTMEQGFYKDRLRQNFDLNVMVPDEAERKLIHDVIYDELCQGVFKPSSKQAYLNIIQNLSDGGAQSIILGCTEIGLLVKPEDTQVPLLNTTEVHAKAAIDMALG